MSILPQSFAYWCFADRGVAPDALFAAAARIGYSGVELLSPELWPVARKHGLAIVGIEGHRSLTSGVNRTENAARIEAELRERIETAVEWNIPILICFSGNRAELSDEAGVEASADVLSRLAPVAADAGVVLAVELLNSRRDHPGYHCDHTGWAIALCQRVNSPAVRLLYDIYHMHVMGEDLLQTIEEARPWTVHYHTAGNPGRGPLNAPGQEIDYPTVFRKIRDIGYHGFIGHEFVPAADPIEALREAYELTALALQEV